MAAAMQPSSTTADSIPDDALRLILLRLPSTASLARAALVSQHWRAIVSDKSFLKNFRQQHPASPLLGFFNSKLDFQTARPVPTSPDLAAPLRYADTALTDFERDWRIQDCRNGRLLLSGPDDSLCIYDPLSQQRVPIRKSGRCAHMDGKYVANLLVLVDGHDAPSCEVVTVRQRGKWTEAAESYHVISVQRCGRDIRAVEYRPGKPEGIAHQWARPWASGQVMPPWDTGAMYAAEHIFWRHRTALLVLDTRTMLFSLLTLPGELIFPSYLKYAIGEIEDGKGCLVCLSAPTHQEPNLEVFLQVWALEKKEGGICWAFKKEVQVSELLGTDARVSQVPMVRNGLALVSVSDAYDQYVVDLQSMTLLTEFRFRGTCFLYQMPWQPAGFAATSSGSTPPLRETSTEVHISQTQISEQHDIGEKSSQDLRGGSARIQPMEVDPFHDELTLQAAGIFPSASCDAGILEDKSETNNLPKNTTEDTEMFEQQNSDKAHTEFSCADKESEALYADNNTLEKNTICGGKVPAESHGCNTFKRQVNLMDEEPGGQRKKRRTNTTSYKTTLGHQDQYMPSQSSSVPCLHALTLSKNEKQSDTGDEVNEEQSDIDDEVGKQESNTLSKKEKQSDTGDEVNEEQSDIDDEVGEQESDTDEYCDAISSRMQKKPFTCHEVDSPKSHSLKYRSVCHRPTHEGKQYFCRYENCDRRKHPFAKKGRLKQHVTDCHDGKPFKCETCGKKFGRKYHLARHFERFHGSRRTLFTCGFIGCREQFPSKRQMKEHEKSEAHVEIGRLKQHVTDCHVGKNFKCETCGKKYGRKYHLDRHVESFHRSRATCGVIGCREQFPSKRQMKEHEKSEAHVELSTGRSRCHFKGCTRTYESRHKLKEHYKKQHVQGEVSGED